MSAFLIIPVLDLKHGQVVRARAGDRASYRPIVSPLACSSAAADVLRGLRTLAPFRTVYVADLDAITGEGSHASLLRELKRQFPDTEFWVDGGFATPAATQAAADGGVLPVVGTESLASAEDLVAIQDALGDGGFVLSLDHRGEQFLGPPEIRNGIELWPARLILMTLDRVGSGGGPDLPSLQELARKAQGRHVFAAGGVRGEQDIAALVEGGIAGALIATALHDGRLDAATLAKLVG